MMTYVSAGTARYDQVCLMNLRTEQGLIGRVVQDVVTLPPGKKAKLQGTRGSIEWINLYDSGSDAVILRRPNEEDQLSQFSKRRTDDFIEELRHVAEHLNGSPAPSDIRLERGLDTVLALAAAHRSEEKGRRVRIDYASGYSLQALVD
jgi:predicted dehydrogenase